MRVLWLEKWTNSGMLASLAVKIGEFSPIFSNLLQYSRIVFTLLYIIMFAVLGKLFAGNRSQAFAEMIKRYEKQTFCTANFLYMGSAMMNNLFHELDPHMKASEEQKEYKKNILESDFLFPDGIGLQVFCLIIKLFSKFKKTLKAQLVGEYKDACFLKNLNGTDFIPYFLENLVHKFGNQKVCLSLYGSYPEVAQKAEKFFSYKGYNVVYSQDGYSDFHWNAMEEKLSEYADTINILIVSTGTPKQENRVAKNINKIEKNNLIVFTGGGFLDHMVGYQKRAGKFIRLLRLERLSRLILQPKNKQQKEKVSKTILGFKQLFRYLLLKKA